MQLSLALTYQSGTKVYVEVTEKQLVALLIKGGWPEEMARQIALDLKKAVEQAARKVG